MLSLGQLLFVSFVLCVSFAAAQSQETTNEVLRMNVSDNNRRLAELEKINADKRLSLIENDMGEVKWLGRSVAGAVIGQLLIAGLGVKRRNER